MTGAVLALDLSRSVGWALWIPGASPAYGTAEFSFSVERGRLASAFDDWLKTKIHPFALRHVDHIFYEAPIVKGPKFTNPNSMMITFGLAWHVEYIASRYTGLLVHPVSSFNWRGHFIGKRSGKRKEIKALAIEECRARGWNPGTDDAADALGILDYGAAYLKLEPDWPARALEGALL